MKPCLLLLVLSVVGAWAQCPPAPSGFQSFPAHCIGYPERGKDCAVDHHVGVGHGSCAKDLNLTACAANIAKQCHNTPDCYSFALRASGASCRPRKDDAISFQLFNIGGNASAVHNDDWLSYTMPGSPAPGPPKPPKPPSPPSPNSGIPVHSDCAVRRLALEFASEVLPESLHAMPVVFDGLELGTRCNDTRPTGSTTDHDAIDRAAGGQTSPPLANPMIFVDPNGGSDDNPGTLEKPVKTVHGGLTLLRALHLPPRSPRSLVLRAGVHSVTR